MRDMGLLAIVPECGARERDVDIGCTPNMGLSGAVAHGDDSIPNSQQRQESKVPQTMLSSQQVPGIHGCPCPRPWSPSNAESVTGDDTKAQGGHGILPRFHSRGRKDPTEPTPETPTL